MISARDLLRSHGGIGVEPQRRELVRTATAPRADLAETLGGRAFGWPFRSNSRAGHDTVDGDSATFHLCGRPGAITPS